MSKKGLVPRHTARIDYAIITDMEPKSPENSAEQLPTPVEFTPISPEIGHDQPAATPERPANTPESGQELHNATTIAAPIQPTQVAVPTVPAPQVGQVTVGSDDDTPQVAADEDLIEKEWVDKAQKIISATKQDPYQQERQVGKLQADYLKKRYGKELRGSS